VAVSAGAGKIDVIAVVIDVAMMMENAPVFQSQVGDQLLAWKSAGLNVALLALVQDAARFEQAVGARLGAAGVRIERVEKRGFLRNLFSMAAALRRLRRTQQLRHAYVRGLWGPVVLALAGRGFRMPYVYDWRGAIVDETRASGAAAYKVALYGLLEGWGIRGARAVTAVSRPLAGYARQRHGVEPAAVVPCCIWPPALPAVESLRAQRRELGFRDEHLVLVYSGGLSHYQQVPATLSVWRLLLDEPDVRFLLLTNESPHSAPAVIGDLGMFGERLVHRSLPRQAVPLALASCDAGFMLRDGRELNRVASPVKFPEYLAAGLAVVGSPGTGDVSELIAAHDLGTLVDPADPDAGAAGVRVLLGRLRRERAAYAQRARALAMARYDWASYAATYRSIYLARDSDATATEA